ncbi:MAG: polysaccharide deacetylase family protein [Bacteroidota bacterium]|nr:polysaccharide deacetylase family protein [Bacteroidota bacterium]
MLKYITAVLLVLLTMSAPAQQREDGIITGLGSDKKIIALTFDACETKTPSYFDEKILSFLINNKIPAAIFLSGKFAVRNESRIKQLLKYNFLEFENHSLNHIQHSEKLSDLDFTKELKGNETVIKNITGRHTRFFRFPAGNYNKQKVKLCRDNGYEVVHWTFASGDPDKNISAKKLISWVNYKTKPGSILIFHINGRGYRTGEALPVIISRLKKLGYSFVKLEDVI